MQRNLMELHVCCQTDKQMDIVNPKFYFCLNIDNQYALFWTPYAHHDKLICIFTPCLFFQCIFNDFQCIITILRTLSVALIEYNSKQDVMMLLATTMSKTTFSLPTHWCLLVYHVWTLWGKSFSVHRSCWRPTYLPTDICKAICPTFTKANKLHLQSALYFGVLSLADLQSLPVVCSVAVLSVFLESVSSVAWRPVAGRFTNFTCSLLCCCTICVSRVRILWSLASCRWEIYKLYL